MVKNDLNGDDDGDAAAAGGLIVDIQDTLLDGIPHVVTVPKVFVRTPLLASCADKGYFVVRTFAFVVGECG